MKPVRDIASNDIAEENLYLLAAAVRGPDNCSNYVFRTLKACITSRIRAILFNRDEVKGDYDDSMLSDTDLSCITEMLHVYKYEKGSYGLHFIFHLMDAVYVSRKHPIWGGKADSLLNLLKMFIET